MTVSQAKIVVLDGYTLNPGDLDWHGLEALGDCTVYDRSTSDQIASRAKDAEIVLTNKAPLSAATISALPNLRYIGVTATGYNVVDVEAARQRDVVVANVPIYGTSSVAQMVFAHLLNLTQNAAGHSAAVRNGRWSGAADWCFWDTPLIELEGLTLGIVGLGRIGRATAKLGQAFGMCVLAATRSLGGDANGVRYVELDEAFQQSDVLSLHCPLTPETAGVVNRERLAMMKPTALLINTSRGQLIDESALADALNRGQLAGAGLDVLSTEPPQADNPLLHAAHCFVTPHIAWATYASRRRLLQMSVENVAAFLRGTPTNVVRP